MTSASWVASHVRYGSCFVPSIVIGMAPSVRRIARTQSSARRPLVSAGSAGFASAARSRSERSPSAANVCASSASFRAASRSIGSGAGAWRVGDAAAAASTIARAAPVTVLFGASLGVARVAQDFQALDDIFVKHEHLVLEIGQIFLRGEPLQVVLRGKPLQVVLRGKPLQVVLRGKPVEVVLRGKPGQRPAWSPCRAGSQKTHRASRCEVAQSALRALSRGRAGSRSGSTIFSRLSIRSSSVGRVHHRTPVRPGVSRPEVRCDLRADRRRRR